MNEIQLIDVIMIVGSLALS